MDKFAAEKLYNEIQDAYADDIEAEYGEEIADYVRLGLDAAYALSETGKPIASTPIVLGCHIETVERAAAAYAAKHGPAIYIPCDMGRPIIIL